MYFYLLMNKDFIIIIIRNIWPVLIKFSITQSVVALYEFFFKKINKFLLIYTMYLPLNWNFTTSSLSLMRLHCQPKTDRKSYSEIVTTAFSTTFS